MFEDLIALHLNVLESPVDHLMGRRVERAATGDIQESPKVAIGIDPGGEEFSLPFSGVLPQNDRSSPVSKKHASISILKIGSVRDDLPPHH